MIIFTLSGHIFNAVRQIIFESASESGTQRAFLCSVFMQIGSFLGTFIMFLLLNVFCLFNDN